MISPTVARITQHAATLTGHTVEEICSPSRSRSLVATRAAVAIVAHDYQMHCYDAYSFSAIGRFFNRHHTSVIHGVACADIYARRDAVFTPLLSGLRALCEDAPAPLQPNDYVKPRPLSPGTATKAPPAEPLNEDQKFTARQTEREAEVRAGMKKGSRLLYAALRRALGYDDAEVGG